MNDNQNKYIQQQKLRSLSQNKNYLTNVGEQAMNSSALIINNSELKNQNLENGQSGRKKFSSRKMRIKTQMDQYDDNSPHYFRNAQVGSCRKVIARGGSVMAVPFSKKNTQEINEQDFGAKKETSAGSQFKPLVPFNYYSERNLMPIQKVKVKSLKDSQIVFGNPWHPYKRTYYTTNKLQYQPIDYSEQRFMQNEGIISQKAKHLHQVREK
ncbi:hypothetical protein PPERSA_05306 [Pseudocohnilembus persalinus]|uniref:Uncharacterized protein n=1 Tax=Pseudocohnilembus persalinus TaxID=266149 RepID=A0A0V0R6E1_PSEPJ|nr:hypothetical protein PPERSA_05306 [Pseudocohnilembus persalinus]|eukprot:KRX09914.1 hypothetical protein PPERSA_05306 [Pseudocohnilembus persalinus]